MKVECAVLIVFTLVLPGTKGECGNRVCLEILYLLFHWFSPSDVWGCRGPVWFGVSWISESRTNDSTVAGSLQSCTETNPSVGWGRLFLTPLSVHFWNTLQLHRFCQVNPPPRRWVRHPNPGSVAVPHRHLDATRANRGLFETWDMTAWALQTNLHLQSKPTAAFMSLVPRRIQVNLFLTTWSSISPNSIFKQQKWKPEDPVQSNRRTQHAPRIETIRNDLKCICLFCTRDFWILNHPLFSSWVWTCDWGTATVWVGGHSGEFNSFKIELHSCRPMHSCFAEHIGPNRKFKLVYKGCNVCAGLCKNHLNRGRTQDLINRERGDVRLRKPNLTGVFEHSTMNDHKQWNFVPTHLRRKSRGQDPKGPPLLHSGDPLLASSANLGEVILQTGLGGGGGGGIRTPVRDSTVFGVCFSLCCTRLAAPHDVPPSSSRRVRWVHPAPGGLSVLFLLPHVQCLQHVRWGWPQFFQNDPSRNKK